MSNINQLVQEAFICEINNIFNNQVWKWSELPISQSDIKRVELKLKVKFPRTYVDLVMNNNAGYPSKNIIHLSNNKNIVFNKLLSLKQKSKDITLEEAYNSVVERLPTKYVPFASDPYGNLFCFNFNSKIPDIYFWDHESNNVKKIFNNIDELLLNLGK
jgi:hypothetical protein